jgi:hypothetical protein
VFCEITRELPQFLVALVQQIVNRGHLVVFVRVQRQFCLLLLKPVLFQHGHDFIVKRNLVFTDDQPVVADYRRVPRGVPGVLPDLSRCVPLVWINVQDLVHEVLTIRRYLRRYLKLPIKDLFVKNVGVWVLKGQVAADHGKEDDSTTPDVDSGPMVSFSGDHFWRSVARGPASRLQRLPFLVGVAETKVHQLDLSIMVEEQIFWLHVPMDNS